MRLILPSRLRSEGVAALPSTPAKSCTVLLKPLCTVRVPLPVTERARMVCSAVDRRFVSYCILHTPFGPDCPEATAVLEFRSIYKSTFAFGTACPDTVMTCPGLKFAVETLSDGGSTKSLRFVIAPCVTSKVLLIVTDFVPAISVAHIPKVAVPGDALVENVNIPLPLVWAVPTLSPSRIKLTVREGYARPVMFTWVVPSSLSLPPPPPPPPPEEPPPPEPAGSILQIAEQKSLSSLLPSSHSSA